MSLDPETLYSWLPAHVRIRDREQGEPLRALMAVLEQTSSALHDDVGRLYRNWFVETCEESLVPAVGDLVGIARLRAMNPGAYTLRAYVANAIALRRRKGTPAALEQVAQDVTGWYASVLEMFQQVSMTQHMKNPRPGLLRTPALRNADEMERIYGAFERTSHMLDVRGLNRDPEPGALLAPPPTDDPVRVLTRRNHGRYNLQTVSLFLWRLRAWPVTLAPAALHDADEGSSSAWYHFNPLGRDLPLFNFPQTKLEAASLTQEHHLPGRLRRNALFLELEARRQAEVDGIEPVPLWFGNQPPLRVYRRSGASGPLTEFSPSEILIADLSRCGQSGWIRPPNTRTYHRAAGGSNDKPIKVVVDPELGRLVFTSGNEPGTGEQVLVSYHYGFSSDLGGGTYDRHAELPARQDFSAYRVRYEDDREAGLGVRLAQWADDNPNTPGAVIELQDNFVYRLEGDGLTLTVPDGKHLELRAANRQRPVLALAGDLTITLGRRSSVTLNGLWIHGGDVVVKGEPESPASVSLVHCTLVPGAEGEAGTGLRFLASKGSQPLFGVSSTVRRSIVGRIDAKALGPGCTLELEDSIIDPQGASTTPALDHGGVLRARASTILGSTRANVLDLASDMLFTGPVMSERRQSGCTRFSYAPIGSELPPRFQCQPQIPEGADSTAREAILYRLTPRFTSVRYGQPGYCQLAVDMPEEILRGASDEGEMGAFNHLEQSQRILNLRAALHEYLRLGLEAGLIFVT